MPYRNIRLHPILRLIYFMLRCVAWLGTSVFYRRRTVLGSKHLRFDGPAIIVANHPSTLMDVLNACIPIRQESFFLANYGLFKNPVSRWLLTRLYCIPVKRREDVAEGEARDNDAAFEQSFRHLEKNGLLFIAAEGVSWMNRWVRPFKTGAARIAFGAERRNDWQLDVKILPIGLSYSAANLFRSEVVIHYGEPIAVSDWAAAEQQDHEQAVDDFTTFLESHVRSLTLDARDEAGEKFLGQVEELLRNEQPLPAREEFFRSKDFLENNIDNEEIRAKIDTYFSALENAKITDYGLRNLTRQDAQQQFRNGLLLIFGLPFFLVGYLFWFLPCYLPWLLTKRLKLYIGYDSNLKMLAGFFTFPLALWAAWCLALHFLGSNLWALIVVTALIGLGYFSEWYMDAVQRFQTRNKAKVFAKTNAAQFERLLALRQSILS